MRRFVVLAAAALVSMFGAVACVQEVEEIEQQAKDAEQQIEKAEERAQEAQQQIEQQVGEEQP